jgi:hypothetical protein
MLVIRCERQINRIADGFYVVQVGGCRGGDESKLAEKAGGPAAAGAADFPACLDGKSQTASGANSRGAE